MTCQRPAALEGELEHWLATLSRVEDAGLRLPTADTVALAAITTGFFAIILIAQAF